VHALSAHTTHVDIHTPSRKRVILFKEGGFACCRSRACGTIVITVAAAVVSAVVAVAVAVSLWLEVGVDADNVAPATAAVVAQMCVWVCVHFFDSTRYSSYSSLRIALQHH